MTVAAEDRDELMVEIRKALALHGFYAYRAPAEQRVASLELAAVAWIRHKRSRKRAKGTIDALVSGWKRIARDIREVQSIGVDRPIPVTVLSQDIFTRLLERWTKLGLSEQRQYDLCLYLYGAWLWIADNPEGWPGVPIAPRDPSSVLLDAPARGSAPDAPTVEEADAICRRAAMLSADLRDVVATLRMTGLRIGQVLALRARDFDMDRATVVVTVGKSPQEKADQREIPVHRSLISLLGERIRRSGGTDLIFPPRKAGAALRTPPDAAVRRLWEAATEAKEVRENVWNPRNRGKARPEHAFRAGFLAALAERAVPEDVRHALVGHAPSSVEGRAYAAPTVDTMRPHVDRLPPIDWLGPSVPANVTSIADARPK